MPLFNPNLTHNIAGNTAGATANIATGTYQLAGGNNITLSQNANSVTISGGAGGGGLASAGISNIGNTVGDTGLVSNRLVLAGGNNVTLSGSTNGGSATVTVSAFNQSNQTANFYVSSNTTQLSSTAGIDLRSVSFQGAGIASVGVSEGKVLVSVPAGGGGGDGGVFGGVSNLGNTAGSTGTVSTGNFVLVGTGPVSLSQSTAGAGSAATISINAPATSSLSATGQVSISTNGSTISIGVPNASTYNSSIFGFGNRGATGSISLGQNSLYFWPHVQEGYLQGSIIKMPTLITLSSSGAGAFTRGHTASFAVYSRSSNNSNSTALTRVYSTSYTAAAVMSSNANMSISVITAVGNSTSYSTTAVNSAGLNLSLSVHGAREFIMPWNTTLTDGEYWFAYAQSSSSAGGVGNVFNVSHSVMSAATVNRMGLSTAASNNGIEKNIGMGTYSATSAGFPSSLPITDIRGGHTFPIVYFLQGTV